MQNENEMLGQLCPNLLKLIEEDIDESRYLVVVDPNIEDEADEADIIDPTEYNWMVFIPDRVEQALGEELFSRIPSKLSEMEIFEDFFDAERDLYGIQSDIDEERIREIVLTLLDRLAVEKIEMEEKES